LPETLHEVRIPSLRKPSADTFVRLIRSRFLQYFGIAWIANLVVALPYLSASAGGENHGWMSFPVDDAWIHLDYVRGLVTQGCLCYNDGIWEAGGTSWGWIFALAIPYALFTSLLDLPIELVVKFVGITIGAFISVWSFRLLLRITGSRVGSMLGSVLIVIEPTSAFHRVSGMEGALVALAALGVTLTLLDRKWLLAGIWMAVGFYGRPEMLYFGLIATSTMWLIAGHSVQLWSLAARTVMLLFVENASSESKRIWAAALPVVSDIRLLIATGFMPAAILVWLGYNKFVNGTWYPNTYLVKHDQTLPTVPIDNAIKYFNDTLPPHHPWLEGWLVVPGVLIFTVGVVVILSHLRFVAVPIVLFPLLMIYSTASNTNYANVQMNFTLSRYFDPAVPAMTLVLVIGILSTVALIRRISISAFSDQRSRVMFTAPVWLVFGIVALSYGVGLLGEIRQSWEVFAWNSRNIWEVDVEMGKWIDENLPEDATVMVFDAGAPRYYGNRYVLDSVGLNSSELIGKTLTQSAQYSQPQYLAYWDFGYAPIPLSEELVAFSAPNNTILGHSHVKVWQINWDKGISDESQFYGVELEGKVLDHLNLVDVDSEIAHNFSVPEVLSLPTIFVELAGHAVIDVAIDHGPGVDEKFTMASIPDSDLTLVHRFRSLAPERQAEVVVDGVSAGHWNVPYDPNLTIEAAFTIPAEYITAETTDITIRWDVSVHSSRWWSVEGPGGDELSGLSPLTPG